MVILRYLYIPTISLKTQTRDTTNSARFTPAADHPLRTILAVLKTSKTAFHRHWHANDSAYHYLCTDRNTLLQHFHQLIFTLLVKNRGNLSPVLQAKPCPQHMTIALSMIPSNSLLPSNQSTPVSRSASTLHPLLSHFLDYSQRDPSRLMCCLKFQCGSFQISNRTMSTPFLKFL